MNKVYKVVWSKVRNAYVVVSELAKNHGKSKSVRTAIVRGVLAAAIAGMPVSGLAALPQPNQPLVNSENATGTGSVAVGQNTTAQGYCSTAMGAYTKAIGDGSTAMGQSTTASGDYSTAMGLLTQATGNISTAMGAYTKAIGKISTAMGFDTTAKGDYSTAMGQSTTASGDNSTAMGVDSKAIGNVSTAMGIYTKAIGYVSTAMGRSTTASGDYSTAMGLDSKAIGYVSTAMGQSTTASGAQSTAMGIYTKAIGSGSTAMGASTTASGNQSTAMGSGTNANGDASTAMGSGTNANGYASTAMGKSTNAKGYVSTAMGSGTNANGDASTAMGSGTTASGVNSTAMGADTKAIGNGSTAMGQSTTASGNQSTAMGYNTQAKGSNALAVGHTTSAEGDNSLVAGYATRAAGDNSVAIGVMSIATGQGALASGVSSLARGANSTALSGGMVGPKGANSIAMGAGAQALVRDAVAIGSGSVADREAGAAGWDPGSRGFSSSMDPAWRSTANAVSVGDAKNGITRQITGVAAGSEDTDAVNVAQLKKAVAGASDGNDTLVTSANGLSLSGNTLSMNVTDTAGNAVTGSVDLSAIAGSVDTRNTVTAGDNVAIDENPNTDGSSTYKINVKADGQVASGNTGIVTGGTVYNETRVTSDGSYVKADNTAGQNLSILDSQVKNNADNISNLDNRVNNMGNNLNKLGDRVDRVGAGAAALAALHPQDFDPDDKWDFAAGYGNYKDAHAVAVGAFYRPNEDTMFSVGGSFGGGENMVNAGVTFKLGQHNHVSRSRVALAKDVLELKQIVAKQDEMIQKLMSGKVSIATKDVTFPDVPKDHWAYTYVKSLADKGYLEGYPDGEFKGDRAMTRYEYATVIYRALQNGAPNDADMSRAVEEFKPELAKVQEVERFRVDRISGKDNDRHKIERVRVNDKNDKVNHQLRDVYGSHIEK